jgi:hypothetical protein
MRSATDPSWGAIAAGDHVQIGAFDVEGVMASPQTLDLPGPISVLSVVGTAKAGLVVYGAGETVKLARGAQGAFAASPDLAVHTIVAAVDPISNKVALVWADTKSVLRAQFLTADPPGVAPREPSAGPPKPDDPPRGSNASPANAGRAAPPEAVRSVSASPTNAGRAAAVRSVSASPANAGRAAPPEAVRSVVIEIGPGELLVRDMCITNDHAYLVNGHTLVAFSAESAEPMRPVEQYALRGCSPSAAILRGDRGAFSVCTDSCRPLEIPGVPGDAWPVVAKSKVIAAAARDGVLALFREGAPPAYYTAPIARALAAMTDGKVIDVVADSPAGIVIARVPVP